MRSTLARISPVIAVLASGAVALCQGTSSTATSHSKTGGEMTAFRPSKRIVLALAIVILAAAAGVAVAAQTIVTDTDNVHLRIVKSQFDDGFDSGWHTHPGPAIVQVQQGRFKIFQSTCEPTTVRAGETYIEVPNDPVLAVAKGEIEWTTTLIYETGQAAATPVASPCPAGEEGDDD
jgi:quercetin dioxygenase-like cupin family protein